MGCGKRVTRPFRQVVEAPVETVQIKVHINSVRRWMPHGQLRVAHPLVTQISCIVVAPEKIDRISHAPGVGGARAQHQMIEAMHFGIGEERKIELGGTIPFPESKAQRMFGCGMIEPAHGALHSQAGVDLETFSSVRINQFGRRGSFPIGALHHHPRVNAVCS